MQVETLEDRTAPAALTLHVPEASSDPTIAVSVASLDPHASLFAIDIDLNHDGQFQGGGELGYAAGDLQATGTVKVHGLVAGTYSLRARLFDGGVSATTSLEVQPPSAQQLPVIFEPNQGQSDDQVLFLGRAEDQMVYITATETVVAPVGSAGPVLRFRLSGANEALPVGQDLLPSVSNYFIGSDQSQWHAGVANFGQVVTRGVYPGIDLVYRSSQNRLEYDFHVKPGADPSAIALDFPDAVGLSIDADGSLVIHFADGQELRKSAPVMYQQRDAVKGDWVIKGPNQAGYVINEYDPARELVIDPLVFASYLGAAGQDTGGGIGLDAAGNIYLAGTAGSATFPTVGAVQGTFGGATSDIFVAKIDPLGCCLLYSTFLGGSGTENGYDLAVDAAGNAYVAGATTSSNFPVTAGAYGSTYRGGSSDAVLFQLNPTGTTLVYSTYLSGSGNDSATCIALQGGFVYAGGAAYTFASDFPTTPGVVQPAGTNNSCFLAKMDFTQSGAAGLIYSTYTCGRFNENLLNDIYVDAAGNLYATGRTTNFGGDFPITAGAYQTSFVNSREAYVFKLNPTATAYIYGTLLAFNGFDEGLGVVADAAGNAYVTGDTSSTNLATTAGVVQPAYGGGGSDGFLIVVNPTGTGLVFATYLGGTSGDQGNDVILDGSNNAIVVGSTDSPNFATATPVQAALAGSSDAFVTQFDATGTSLVFSTFLGGTGADNATAVTTDAAGNIFIVGTTRSSNFPVTLGAFQTTQGGGGNFDVFVAKFGSQAVQAVALTQTGSTTTLTEGGASDSYTVVLTSLPTADVVVTLTADAQVATSQTLLTFTPLDWNSPQTVTITAVDDSTVEGTHAGLMTHTVSSTDLNFNGVPVCVLTARLTDNDIPGVNIVQSGGTTAVTEGGATDSYTVVLGTAPTANVLVTLTPGSQATLSASVLTFTTVNWNVLQTVVVTAVNDSIAEGAQTATITHAATSADAAYNAIAISTVTAGITDNDTAGVTITPTAGSTTVTEGGANDTYTVVLDSQPVANVVLNLNSGTQVTVSDPALTFTALNWNVPQTITVTAVDDAAIEGAHSGVIQHAAVSGDPNYGGTTNHTASVNDNDFPAGVNIVPSGGATSVTEAGLTDTYTVVLNSTPTANVVVTLNAGSQLIAGPTRLTFTPATWNVLQTVNVAAVEDLIAEGSHNGVVAHTASSTDPIYSGIAIASLTANIADNDSASMLVSPATVDVAEGGFGTTYTVRLTSQPTANVVVAVNPGTQASVSATTLVFTPADWNVAQTVNIQAVEDSLVEGAHIGLVTHTGASVDTMYNTLTATVTARITDNDNPGVLISQTNGPLTILESTVKSYTVVLASPPTADVVVNISPDAQLSVAPSSLTFTAGDWDTPRPVLITALDDGLAEGDHFGILTHSATSTDTAYNGLAIDRVLASIVDNDGSSINGTDKNDQITVSFTSTRIQVAINGKVTSLPSTLAQLLVYAQGGNDNIQIANPTIPVVVIGGPGLDKTYVTGQAGANAFVLGESSVTTNGSSVGVWEVESLTVSGKASNDIFTVLDVPSFPVEFKGDTGVDTVIGPDRANTWRINTSNGGTLDGTIKITTIENWTGGSSVDAFAFAAGKSLTGRVNGGSGQNTLDYSAASSPIAVNLQTSAATGVKGFANITRVIGGKGLDRLTAADQSNLWDITSGGGGTVGGVSFLNMENLTGGLLDDTFVVADGQGVRGKIDGGAGSDLLDFTGYLSKPVIINLQTKTATGTGGFVGLEAFQGGSGTADNLIGANVANSWQLGGTGSGAIGTINFGNFENLTGGTLADTFTLLAGGEWLGTLNGGAGNDVLTAFSGQANLWVNTGLGAGTLNGRKFLNVETRR